MRTATRTPSEPRRRRVVSRLARVAAASVISVGALVGVAASPAGAVEVSDWGALGWNSTNGFAGPQTFTDVGDSGVDLTVAYGTGMWDNDSTPNVYGGAAPVAGLQNSLRFTNDISGAAAPLTLTFSQPVQVAGLTVGSLSSIGSNYEFVTIQGFDAGNNLVTTTTTSTSRLSTASPTTPIVPGGTVVTDDGAGTITARGGGRQEDGEYDQVTVGFGSTAVSRIVISHVNRSGPSVGDAPAAALASVVLAAVDFSPVLTTYDLGLTNVLTSFDPTTRQATFRVTVCNQGTAASGAATVEYVLPAGLTYVSPSAVGPRLTLTLPASLAPGGCTTFDIVAEVAPGTTGQLVTAAEIGTDSGDDIDSTPSTTPAVGSAAENDRTVVGDALTVNTDPSEDDRDIAILDIAVPPPPTTAPPITAPPTTPTTAPPVTTPGTRPTAVTLPATGPAEGVRNPAIVLAAALALAWFGAVVARRGSLLGGGKR